MQEVLPDGIHIKPLTITLSPWPPQEVEVVDQNHPWSLKRSKRRMYGVTLADVYLTKPNALKSVIQQMPLHMPKGKVIIPLTPYLKKKHAKWKHDTHWTTGLSPKSSILQLCAPGQNKLGEMLEHAVLTRRMEQSLYPVLCTGCFIGTTIASLAEGTVEDENGDAKLDDISKSCSSQYTQAGSRNKSHNGKTRSQRGRENKRIQQSAVAQ